MANKGFWKAVKQKKIEVHHDGSKIIKTHVKIEIHGVGVKNIPVSTIRHQLNREFANESEKERINKYKR